VVLGLRQPPGAVIRFVLGGAVCPTDAIREMETKALRGNKRFKVVVG
jgi:hypothetical protein